MNYGICMNYVRTMPPPYKKSGNREWWERFEKVFAYFFLKKVGPQKSKEFSFTKSTIGLTSSRECGWWPQPSLIMLLTFIPFSLQ